MTSTSETGHAKNVANLDALISSVIGFGTAYNPSKSSIQVTALQSLSADAKNSLSTVNKAIPGYSNAVADREVAFEPLQKLSTRILNSLKATDASDQVIDSAKSLVRKLQGRRATPKKTEAEMTALAAEGTVVKQISTSQLSFDSQLNTFDQLIQLLDSITLYAPNETDLKVSALTAMYTDLAAKNTAVLDATVPLSNARIARNDLFNKADTGLVSTAADTKSYIKSVFGANSPQYRQVSKLAFKAVKV